MKVWLAILTVEITVTAALAHAMFGDMLVWF
jgi:hypothetical protein